MAAPDDVIPSLLLLSASGEHLQVIQLRVIESEHSFITVIIVPSNNDLQSNPYRRVFYNVSRYEADTMRVTTRRGGRQLEVRVHSEHPPNDA